MEKHAHDDPTHSENGLDMAVVPPAYGILPNRLMATLEVAAFVGCHEETVRRGICAVY